VWIRKDIAGRLPGTCRCDRPKAVKCAVTASSWPLEIAAGLAESDSDHSCSLPVALCPNKSTIEII
jgi:hypothetical protein